MWFCIRDSTEPCMGLWIWRVATIHLNIWTFFLRFFPSLFLSFTFVLKKTSIVTYHHRSQCHFLLYFENSAIKGDDFPIIDVIVKYEGNTSVEGTLEILARAELTVLSVLASLVILCYTFVIRPVVSSSRHWVSWDYASERWKSGHCHFQSSEEERER